MIIIRLAACAVVVFGLTTAAHAQAGFVEASVRGDEAWCRTTPIGQMSRGDITLCEMWEHGNKSLERALAKERVEAQRATLYKGGNYRDPGASNLCPAPHYRMTERDGCQPARR